MKVSKEMKWYLNCKCRMCGMCFWDAECDWASYASLTTASVSNPRWCIRFTSSLCCLLIKANRRNDVYITLSSVKQIQLHIKKIQQLWPVVSTAVYNKSKCLTPWLLGQSQNRPTARGIEPHGPLQSMPLTCPILYPCSLDGWGSYAMDTVAFWKCMTVPHSSLGLLCEKAAEWCEAYCKINWNR